MAIVRRENTPTRYRDHWSLARDLFGWDPFNEARPAVTFAPAFEVKETADQFVVKADLPGVKEENLDVSLHNGVLSIAGARTAEERKENESYFLYERQFGSFSRSFALPDTADPEKIQAKLEHGELTLTIGKRVEAKPRKIQFTKS
ncbi:MAG TPA: Hsp20/alpha crystallin family protein [Kofleriaceae bacterium]|nr:Hsp20/alpha crystallin family protein [Kofleriaceae bacterium]